MVTSQTAAIRHPATSLPTTADELLSRAEDLVPVLRAVSDDIEQARRLPAAVVQQLRDAGVFRMGVPVEQGGPGLDSVQQTEVVEILARGDASAAWCAMIGMDTPLYAQFLPESVARDELSDPDAITAGLILPLGRAERVPGGYRVTGRWQFGSGITHADWVVAGCFVHRDGQPEPGPDGGPGHWRIMLAPRQEFEVIDTWHTTGLAGSGSCDYQAHDLFVPERHSFSLGTPRTKGPYATPEAILRNMPGVPLGVARAALDHVRELAAGRTDRAAATPWADTYRVQLAVAESEMELSAARHAVYGSLRRQLRILEAGGEIGRDDRVDTVLARVNAFRVARTIVSRLYDLVATTAVYRPSPLDRWLRDLTTMRQHVIAQDQVLQSAGAHLLGGTPYNPFSLGIVA
ncbi:alkylation response protein AidB-like acyl-CoA dehydrogenase [Streptomyces aurantiacus]|uniref:acyl-CoA dehydrogenase family protein n=1 Tax=Streptomyces aurantiacus TaxID=47760 RepID=UPI0027916595|nr:acyl-CoA dehydrogenase family protein [Streptomyces aurantiacus]MDQ0773211.1 alkylation response protein AidB-like acyl-CoA dehydrogenase [Streptomyces aurantiacus]